MGGGDEGLAPLVEDGLDLDGVLFGDVLVGAGGDEAEDVGEGGLGGVVRGEADVGVREGGLGVGSGGGEEEWATPERGRAEEQRGESHAFEEGSPGKVRFFVAVIWHDSRWRNGAGKASAGYHPGKIAVRGERRRGMWAKTPGKFDDLNLLVDSASMVGLMSVSSSLQAVTWLSSPSGRECT